MQVGCKMTDLRSHIILYADIASHQLPEPTLSSSLVLSHLPAFHEHLRFLMHRPYATEQQM